MNQSLFEFEFNGYTMIGLLLPNPGVLNCRLELPLPASYTKLVDGVGYEGVGEYWYTWGLFPREWIATAGCPTAEGGRVE